ncbi:hypothetical protein ACTXT7_002981 [Hymenolepis weldensis]
MPDSIGSASGTGSNGNAEKSQLQEAAEFAAFFSNKSISSLWRISTTTLRDTIFTTPPGETSHLISSEESHQQQNQSQPSQTTPQGQGQQRFNSASESSNSTPPSNSAIDGASSSSRYHGSSSSNTNYPTSRSTDPHLQSTAMGSNFPQDAPSSVTPSSTPQPQPTPLYSPRSSSYSMSSNRPPSPPAQSRLAVDPRMPSHSMQQQPAAQSGQHFSDQSYAPPPPPPLAASQQAIYEHLLYCVSCAASSLTPPKLMFTAPDSSQQTAKFSPFLSRTTLYSPLFMLEESSGDSKPTSPITPSHLPLLPPIIDSLRVYMCITHPLYPLLMLIFEKCELATCTPRDRNNSRTSADGLQQNPMSTGEPTVWSSVSFDSDILAFAENDGKTTPINLIKPSATPALD